MQARRVLAGLSALVRQELVVRERVGDRERLALGSLSRQRLVQVLVDDPEPLLYEREQLYRDGERVGEVKNGAYGHTLGGGVGLASIDLEDNVTDDFINSGSWELDIVGTRYPATVSLTPLYDPKRERIKA